MKVVTHFHLKEIRWAISDTDRARIETRFPGTQIVSVEDAEQLPQALADADVYCGWQLPADAFAAAQRLRWAHLATAGVDTSLTPELAASDVVLTNSAGLHSVCIPEHVLGQMLVLARNFHEALRLQARGEWNRFQVISYGATIRELGGSRLAILGAGAIGCSLARMAAALGMTVRVLRRDTARGVPGAEAVCPPESLHELLGWADFVVLAVPLTAETRGLIDRRALAAMKSDSYLINVARGEVVDDAALVEALRSGGIAGAALDVFDPEPLPAGHPFWAVPNLVLTPHISGYTPNYFQKVLDLFEANLARFLSGEPLRNVVDKSLGYVRSEA